MAITPDDILNKEFSKTGRGGYLASEVNEFLDTVNADYRSALEENASLKAQINGLKTNTTDIDALKDQVNRSIIIAQESAERLRRETEEAAKKEIVDAHKTAQKIVADAREKGDSIIDGMAELNAQIISEQDYLRKKVISFRKAMEKFYSDELRLIKDDKKWQDAIEPLTESIALNQYEELIEETPEINAIENDDSPIVKNPVVDNLDEKIKKGELDLELPQVKTVDEIRAELESNDKN